MNKINKLGVSWKSTRFHVIITHEPGGYGRRCGTECHQCWTVGQLIEIMIVKSEPWKDLEAIMNWIK